MSIARHITYYEIDFDLDTEPENDVKDSVSVADIKEDRDTLFDHIYVDATLPELNGNVADDMEKFILDGMLEMVSHVMHKSHHENLVQALKTGSQEMYDNYKGQDTDINYDEWRWEIHSDFGLMLGVTHSNGIRVADWDDGAYHFLPHIAMQLPVVYNEYLPSWDDNIPEKTVLLRLVNRTDKHRIVLVAHNESIEMVASP